MLYRLLNRDRFDEFGKWPKKPPTLTPEQKAAREAFMKLWHQELPNKYGVIEKFNHGYVASLPCKAGSRTLEIGAGLGEHSKFEDLRKQDYYSMDYREEFCRELEKRFPKDHVWLGDIHVRQPCEDGSFDRIVAVHVLEHLLHLPAALAEIHRLLKDDGVFDIVVPTEGGLAHTFARKISAQRMFEKHFGMSFHPITRNEHVSTFPEIISELKKKFTIQRSRFFPTFLPLATINLCAGFRLAKRLPRESCGSELRGR